MPVNVPLVSGETDFGNLVNKGLLMTMAGKGAKRKLCTHAGNWHSTNLNGNGPNLAESSRTKSRRMQTVSLDTKPALAKFARKILAGKVHFRTTSEALRNLRACKAFCFGVPERYAGYTLA